jgi:hypothetical protein
VAQMVFGDFWPGEVQNHNRTAMANPHPTYKFPKGNRANPGGRPKDNPELIAACCAHTEEAIQVLVEWMRKDDKAAITAANAILDRGWSKPAQQLEHSGGLGLTLKKVLEHVK